MSLSLSMRGLAMAPKSSSAVIPPAGLSAYVYDTTVQAWAAQVAVVGGAVPSHRRMMTMDNLIRALKDPLLGINRDPAYVAPWSKIRQLGFTGADLLTTAVSMRYPGTKDMSFTGAITFVANQSVAGAAGRRLNLNVFLDELDPANMMIGFYGTAAAATGLPEMGATDVSGNGCKLIGKKTTSLVASGFLGDSTEVALSATTDVDGSGWEALNRTTNSSYDFWKGARKVSNQASVSAASFGHVEIVALSTNNNGVYANSTKAQFGWVVGDGMTDTQMEVIAAVMQDAQDKLFFGELDVYPAASLPATATYDVVIYGGSSFAVTQAYEAKRRGRSVCIVRSPLEGPNIGGMTANGLGQFDWTTAAKFAGLPKWMLTKSGASSLVVETLRFNRTCRSMLDPRTNVGLDIPVYESTGIASVASTMVGGDKYQTSFTTNDGRTFTANQGFADCTYEGLLAKAAGITMTYGRDAAGTGTEGNSGATGITAAFGAIVDPWVTPNTPASGLLLGLSGRADVGFPVAGSADGKLMRPNYRITLTNDPLRRIPFKNVKPSGYDAMGGDAYYEPLARAFANGIYTSLGQIMKFSNVGAGINIYDINNLGGWSTDVAGVMDGYLTKTTAQQLAVWDKVAAIDNGLIYWLLFSGDSRIPAGIITSLSAYGYDHYNNTRVRAGRNLFEPQQMYVRSGYRMVSDFVLTANDAVMADGTTPRSIKTVSLGSYQIDDHGPETWAYLQGGTTWSIGNEGQQNIPTGGTDVTNPIPYEIYTPKRAESCNMLVMYAASVTSLEYGNLRMEGTAMLASQFMGYVWAEMAASVVPAVQDVNYDNARTACLAGTGLLTVTATETVPLLPQVN